MDLELKNFHHWSPIRIYARGREVYVDWCFLGEDRFTESFHDNTIDIRWREPFNLLFRHQTSIDFLGEIYEKSRGITPKGFIFHVSRCGSTLVSQMLAALPKNIVISEASVIDKIIRPTAEFSNIAEEQRIIWLRWLFNALAQKRFQEEENFFIKFDSWSILDLPFIEKAFPGVPWIFMYRNPVEVIVSNLRQPGAQMIPGAIGKIFPNLDFFEILKFSIEERFARTIGAFCQAALANAASRNGRLINYTQLPEAVTGEICEHFGTAFSTEETEKMRGSSKFHAKTPQFAFTPDSEQKRKEASEKVVRCAEEFVVPFYEKLEILRSRNDT